MNDRSHPPGVAAPGGTQPAVDGTAPGSPDRPGGREWLGLLGILVLAAATRLPGLADRGRWNADQGDQMLAIHDAVTTWAIPLLGPLASTGSFHHGPLFYWLMAPAALVSGSDPLAVALWLTVLGLGAVAATWWLARLTGGPVAAVVAGLLAALSSSMIESSTFIWNPNPIALFAALAAVGTIQAHRTGRARWWLLAATGAMAVMQLHTLAALLSLPIAATWLWDTIRVWRDGRSLRPWMLGGLGGLLILVAGFGPMLVHDVGNGFAESRALVAYVTGAIGGGAASGAETAGGAAMALPGRMLVIGLRSLTWPVNGLFVTQPAVSVLVAVVIVSLAVLAVRRRPAWAARWQVAVYVWSVVVLALAAPALATVTPQLPNDHYHAFLDPLVLTVSGAGVARLWAGVSRRDGRPRPEGAAAGSEAGRGELPAAVGAVTASTGRDGDGRIVRRGLAVAAVLVLGAATVTGWPPVPAYDGGFPVADAAALRISETLDGRSPALVEIPDFKTAEGMEFPLVRRGVRIAPDVSNALVVVVECDPLFEQVVGAACGGEAERAWQAAQGIGTLRLIDRFEAGPRRWITVYENDMGALRAP